MCVVPWTNLVVQPDGCASFCCYARGLLTVDGRPGQLGRDSMDDLWNSEDLVEVRAAMARGDRPEQCVVCWEREDVGATSPRHGYDGIYERAGGEIDLLELAEVGRDTGYRLERPPDWFVIELGSVCNLRCRMCAPISSSSIAADEIHAKWNAHVSIATDDGAEPGMRKAPSAANPTAWFTKVDELADMIASSASERRTMLSLMGGEPFLIKQTWQLLEALIERGVAHNIFTGLSTNGQFRSRKVEELAPHFRGFSFNVSIDGHGALFEYLRHGGKWDKVVGTLDWLQSLPAPVSVAATVSLQNGNALNIVELISFLDDRAVPITANVVTTPTRLRPDNLPPAIRQRAAARLREYLALSCSPLNVDAVTFFAERFEHVPEEAGFDGALFDEFLTFMAELDEGRGQSLAVAAPELVEMLAAEGVAGGVG